MKPDIKKSELLRRIGKLTITDELLHLDPDAVQKVLSKVIVVRCEHHYYKDAFEYIAFSNHFYIVPEGNEIPEYQAIMSNGEVSFKKVKY